MKQIAMLALVLGAFCVPAQAGGNFFIGTGKFASPRGMHQKVYGANRGQRTIGIPTRGISAAQVRSKAQGRTGPAQTLGNRARIDAAAKRRYRPYHKRQRYNPVFYGDTIREETIVIVQPPAPAPPPEPEVVVVTPPPDPRGPRFAPARGIVPAAPLFAVGAPLPRREPFVTLDWRRFELPEPGIGQEYVRLGRDVLLIDSTSRVVLEAVQPS